MVNLLSIAGTDPSSGAGIQRDLRTFAAHGHCGFSAVTVVTSQNSKRFTAIRPMPPSMVLSQIDDILDEFELDGIKIGAVYSSEIIKAVHAALKNLNVPIILDPIIRSSTGSTLLRRDAMSHFKKLLLPLAAAVTPNVSEAQDLTGAAIDSRKSMAEAAQMLFDAGAQRVIITGLGEGNRITDCIFDEPTVSFISSKRRGSAHGGGCTHSAVLTVHISEGAGIADAAGYAKEYTTDSFETLPSPGTAAVPESIYHLQDALGKIQQIKKMHTLIPEVQSNFGYARKNAKTMQDVAAVRGRIVRAGKSVIVAGSPAFGASRHVASAILEVKAKFPEIRAGFNIRYEPTTISKLMDNGANVISYDRSAEPENVQKKEGRSIPWGIARAVSDTEIEPDVIYHKGAMGKEPMIILFGHSPMEIIQKIRCILE